ncbi:glycosyltransferase [Candidatus Roizmanbacteria bacterium]|nr:glycosyltransferase [Candidatus Roizmanbacteria bacterium]
MKQEKNKLLSVIVPCYKQEKTVMASIKRIQSVLETLDFPYEIIVVVDGIVDKTYEWAKQLKSSSIIVVKYQYNHGKGYALRYGMARSRGSVIAFIDCGTDLDPMGLKMLLAHYEWYDADIIVGSKWHPVSIVTYPWWRVILSRGYGLYVKLLFNLRVSDTQLGMKLFKRNVLEDVLPRLLVKKFAFDIEMLAVANRIGYTRIYEAPVELHWQEIESTLTTNLFKSIWEMFMDTLAVFYRLYILKYYDNSGNRKWRYDKDLDFKINVG